MATISNRRESWDSLSSNFGKLDVSYSQDSSYGSDEVSISSNTTAPLQSSIATSIDGREEPSLRPFLKSILKKPTSSEHDDGDVESGYDSDNIDGEYDPISDNDADSQAEGDESESESEIDEDDDDDNDEEEDSDDEDKLEYSDADSADFSDFSVWDEDTLLEVPESRNDHTESFDDSFIGFGVSVHFHPHIQYFDCHTTDEDESDTQMTLHEIMRLRQQSGDSQDLLPQSDAEDMPDDEHEIGHREFASKIHIRLEDFTDDTIEDDRRQFTAYMVAIHGALQKYGPCLHTQADNIRLGNEAEPAHPNDAPYLYLDTVTNHVIGTFRHLLAADELDNLITARKNNKGSAHAQSEHSETHSENSYQVLLTKIEQLLLDRLTNGLVDITPDELSFFAGGVLHALGTRDLPSLT